MIENAEIKKDIDEIIKGGVGRMMEKYYSQDEPMTDEDMKKLGCPLPPDELFDKIKIGCGYKCRLPGRRFWRAVIVAAVIAVIMCGAGAMALKFFGIDMEVRRDESTIRIIDKNEEKGTFTGTNDEMYDKAEKEAGFTLRRPSYIPEGFYIDSVRVRKECDVTVKYIDDSGGIIRIMQFFHPDNGGISRSVDTLEGDMRSKTILNHEVLFAKYEQNDTESEWITAVWKDDVNSYTVTANIGEEEIEKVVTGML